MAFSTTIMEDAEILVKVILAALAVFYIVKWRSDPVCFLQRLQRKKTSLRSLLSSTLYLL